jgi:hypothetical protein
MTGRRFDRFQKILAHFKGALLGIKVDPADHRARRRNNLLALS